MDLKDNIQEHLKNIQTNPKSYEQEDQSQQIDQVYDLIKQILPDLEKEIKKDIRDQMEYEYKQKLQSQSDIIREEA